MEIILLNFYFRMQNPNALFMMRDCRILEDIPESQLSRYQDTDELQVQHLKVGIFFLVSTIFQDLR